jgi:ADP-ribosylglycohydrolase
MNITVDRCRGVLLGLAAGDRIGGPIRMALLLDQSLLECRGLHPEDVLNRYLHWWREGAFDMGPVSACVLQLISSGLNPREATLRVHQEFSGKTAGCNPAHRSAPLVIHSSIPDDDLARCALAEASLTHFDPLAGEVAAIVTIICRSLIRGNHWHSARCRGEQFASQDAPAATGEFAPDVLRSALFFVNEAQSFPEALERSLVFTGPANYCPVLVGAIGGARWGASAIPPAALSHSDLLPKVNAAADALVATWQTE